MWQASPAFQLCRTDSKEELCIPAGLEGNSALRTPGPALGSFVEPVGLTNPSVFSGPGLPVGLQLGSPQQPAEWRSTLVPACVLVVGSCPARLVARLSGAPRGCELCFLCPVYPSTDQPFLCCPPLLARSES